MLRDALRFWSLAGERGEDAVENAEPAPAYEAVVERLVRPITPGRVFPLQTVANHIAIPLTTRRSSTRGTP